MEQEALLASTYVKNKNIEPGMLLVLRNYHDQWNTSHQHARPIGFVVKAHIFENTQDKRGACAYQILFSNGALEYEMEGYVRNVYKVVE